MTVGLIASYTWDETTQMACVVGEFAKQLSLPVSYLATSAREQAVHSEWDDKVRSLRKLKSFKEWAYEHEQLVWFDVQKKRLEEAKKVGCSNTLVPLWNRMEKWQFAYMSKFQHIACPSLALYQKLQRRFPGHTGIHYTPWCNGSRTLRRPSGWVDDRWLHIYISVDGTMVEHDADTLFTGLFRFLSKNNNTRITIGHGKRWKQSQNEQVSSLLRMSHGRVRMVKALSREERLQVLSQNDIVFPFSLRPNSGAEVLEALAFGIPVATFDIHPYDEIVAQGQNGLLFECTREVSPCGAMMGVVNGSTWHNILVEISESKQSISNLQSRDWPELERRCYQFCQAWKDIWSCI